MRLRVRKDFQVLRPTWFAAWSILFLAWSALQGSIAHAEVVSTDTLSSPQQVGDSLEWINKEDAKLLEAAIAAFQAGDRAEFSSQYKAALEKSDRLPALEIFLTKLLIESSKVSDALQTVEVYLREHAEDSEAYIALGEIAMRSGRWTDAWLSLSHADRLIKDKKLKSSRLTYIVPVLVEMQASVAEQRQLWDEAEELYKRLGTLMPEKSYPLWRQGRVRLQRGRTAEGIQMMATARKQTADLPSPELTAALFFAEKSDATQAEEWFRAAIRKETNDPVRWHEYLKWLLIRERASDAAGLFAKMPSEAKSARNVRVIEGLVARFQGDLGKAELIFSELTQADTNDAEAADQLVLVLIESADEGKRGRALQLSELNLRRANSIQNVIATAAWVQFKLGAVDVADRLLGQLAEQAALQPQTAYYVARVLEAKGQSEDAKKVLKAAVDTPGIFVERAKARQELKSSKP
jgi:tetratricopeptide (TPR) repeat protein